MQLLFITKREESLFEEVWMSGFSQVEGGSTIDVNPLVVAEASIGAAAISVQLTSAGPHKHPGKSHAV